MLELPVTIVRIDLKKKVKALNWDFLRNQKTFTNEYNRTHKHNIGKNA
jgi:hypothetical protein